MRENMRTNIRSEMRTLLLVIFALSPVGIEAQIAAGGNFSLLQSTLNGGASTAGATFTVVGTEAQPIAGVTSTGPPYLATAGFWSSVAGTTSARVNLGGRVTTADGSGIRNVRVVVTTSAGFQRSIMTSAFGYYLIEGVSVGETFTVNVVAKHYHFTPRIVHLNDSLQDLDFVSIE